MGKTLMILGGSRYILPIIESAHELGHRVVTCDYLPNNIAHKYSDAYENVSIVDQEAVLDAARRLKIDGIMSFAADPGVVSAAYVAEQMDLPFQGSYEAVSILQHKDLFRGFLRDHGFNCPRMHVFKSADEAMKNSDDIVFPVIVKPTDSAGSKGCTRVNDASGLSSAVEYALSFSLSDTCIVEQFIEKKGDSSDADGFTINGKFECISFTSQLFDVSADNPYVPAAYTMPSSMSAGAQEYLKSELQRLADLLELRDGVYNIETRVGIDGKPYIMEMSPRGGGNRLCEMLRYSSGVDLIRASVQSALGDAPQDVRAPEYDGSWYQLMLHSKHGGTFQGVKYAPDFKEEHVRDEQLWIKPGTQVHAFTGANFAFGSIFMRFDDPVQLRGFLCDQEAYIHVIVG